MNPEELGKLSAALNSLESMREHVTLAADSELAEELGVGPIGIVSGIISAVSLFASIFGKSGPSPTEVIIDALKRLVSRFMRVLTL
ncbi:MAG: hypothetical protein R3A13_00455 [Bdellovibrionota bacterium]